MKLLPILLGIILATTAFAQEANLTVKHDIPYVESDNPLQTLDVYSPAGAKSSPVVVWIHGGGWQGGDKTQVKEKPAAFGKKGIVFVSVNYRLLPKVAMGDLNRDVAKSIHWVHDHAAEYGGDPQRLFIMGHSAGAELAALLCTDEGYLQAEGIPLSIVKGCVPVDGDTYDVPAIIAVEETRVRTHGLQPPKYGHAEKFGTPEQQKDYSAVSHVAKDKNIPPFLVLHVAAHPDTSAQAIHLGNVLKDVGIPVKVFGAKDTDHNKLNDNLGIPGDPATGELFEFVDHVLKP